MVEQEKAESLVDIDLYQLHEEWRLQAKKVVRYGLKLAEAKQDVAEAKGRFELVEANLKLKIRNEPENYGLTKATEDAVKACVITQDEYQRAQREYNRKRFLADQLQVVLNGLDHKKKALEDLVYLHGISYFAEPQARREETAMERKRAVRRKGRYRPDE